MTHSTMGIAAVGAAVLAVLLAGCDVPPAPPQETSAPSQEPGARPTMNLCVVGGLAQGEGPHQSFGSLMDRAVQQYYVPRQHLFEGSMAFAGEGPVSSSVGGAHCDVLFVVGEQHWSSALEVASKHPEIHIVLAATDTPMGGSELENVSYLVVDYAEVYELAGFWNRPTVTTDSGPTEVGGMVLVVDSGDPEQERVVTALRAGIAAAIEPGAPDVVVLDVAGLDRAQVEAALEGALVHDFDKVVPIDERTAPWVVAQVVQFPGRALLVGAGIDLRTHYPAADGLIFHSVSADLLSPITTILDAVRRGEQPPDLHIDAVIHWGSLKPLP